MIEWIVGFVDRLGYLGVGLLMLIENVFPPIPSELIMPFAGFASARGEINFVGAVIAGSVGALAGTIPWYVISRKMSEERVKDWVDSHGRWLTLDHRTLDRAQAWFERHDQAAVFICRLLPGVRTWISVPAGLENMPFWKFLLYSAVGTVLWSAALAFAGRLTGQNYERIADFIGPAAWIIVGLITATFAGWVLWRRKRGKGRGGP